MRERVGVFLGRAVRVETLDRVDELPVQEPPAVCDDSPVRHVVRQRVLERVLRAGRRRHLTNELRRAQDGELSLQLIGIFRHRA